MSAPQLLSQAQVGGYSIDLGNPPTGLRADAALGLLFGSEQFAGNVVYTATDALYEARATITPGGDYLLMFPTNTADRPRGRAHYGGQTEKVNDMVAMRSSDRGQAWTGPIVAYDIDYNQHGFIPFIPSGSDRIYAFGTQPVWSEFTTERGLQENAPIGYRYSDDDGYHWSEVRLIRPVNDPGFRGMSVMRMCETANGTWLLGSHEGDWSFKPLMTRQYILRSEDQGKSWEVLPHPPHGGWAVPEYNRMDEGRPIALADGRVLLMLRTCEGHLWAAWSEDDGKSWSNPEPTSLVHPDAPPMVFMLSDGATLAAFHHNRHHNTTYQGLGNVDGDNTSKQDRSEIWVSTARHGVDA
jgi:predicted neuraminidase